MKKKKKNNHRYVGSTLLFLSLALLRASPGGMLLTLWCVEKKRGFLLKMALFGGRGWPGLANAVILMLISVILMAIRAFLEASMDLKRGEWRFLSLYYYGKVG
jgi:hypothetical protein